MKRSAFFLFASLLTMVFSLSCAKPELDIDKYQDKEFEPVYLTKSEQEIGQASNQFGFDVYHKIYEGKDILISPLSLSLALSMAANGAEGKTSDEMLSTLGFAGKEKADMNNYYRKMVKALLEADPKTTFEVANSIWADEKIGVKESFTDVTKEFFASEVYPADFNTQATVNAINKWCSDKTHGKIPTIMGEPDPTLVMALINALYFKGEWSFEFNDKTKKEDFTDLTGGKAKVDMMSAEEKLLYAEKDGYAMVRLPYGNGSFSMDVILPPKGKDFGEAVKAFDAGSFENLDYGMSDAIVNLKLPKFTFEYSKSLVSTLQALGMKQAFTNTADFSAMAEKSLKISTVLQKTFIDVNEKGTEAAAVTFIGMMTTSVAPANEPRRVDFFADRPFLFMIRENSTGAILVIGQKVK